MTAGAVMALGQPPVSLPIALFLALPVILWRWDGGAGFRTGWLVGLGYFGAGLFWIVEPFQVDPERHGWMAPFALAGLAGGLALFWGLAFAVARRFWRPGWERVVILAAVWTFAEYARSHVLTGFPWALVAYAWVETPVMQAAAFAGPHVIGFVTLAAALLVGANWRVGAPLAAALVAAVWAGGSARLAAPLPERAEPYLVRIVQPNAPQSLKWRPGMQQVFYERHIEATRAPADRRPDVTIWSETAVPFALGQAPGIEAEMAEAAAPGRLILGIQRTEAGRWFNSLAVLGSDGAAAAVYDKHHLVPFGEYIPFGALIAGLGIPAISPLAQGGFSPGPGPRAVETEGIPRFLALICYEAIFPHQMRAAGARPEWIVQVTNDAWFGDLAGPYQHLAQARVRAIEQGLPLARAANTGVSALIGPRGEVLASLNLNTSGYLDAELPSGLSPTLYARTGDLLGLVVIGIIFGLTVANFWRGIFFSAGS